MDETVADQLADLNAMLGIPAVISEWIYLDLLAILESSPVYRANN